MDERERLEARLLSIYHRVQWIADDDLRAAWVKGAAEPGEYLAEKERLLEETDLLLAQLESQASA